ncbi:MAG: alpha/beta hydrolase [Caldilineaceae bacterium]
MDHVRVGLFPKIAISIIGLMAILVAGSVYQQSAAGRDRATYVPGDALIEVRGVEMHLRCEGEGSPAVLFESGAGASYLNWWAVQQAIVQDVRTCVYDRQGLGWSAYTGITPTAEFVAQTLHTLLENAGESGPYVLVGHSLGGLYVREYAAQYPDHVAGIVLIDAVHQQQHARLPQALAALGTSEPLTLRLCRLLAPSGILRLFNVGASMTPYAEDTPIYHEDIAIFYQSQFCAGISVDVADALLLDTTTAPASLGNIPLAVLTAGIPMADRPERYPAEISREMLQEADRVWLELQGELAALSTNSAWTVVENAAHFIHHDQPQVVIEAINGILTESAGGQSTRYTE